jgi:DNA-binding PadR family transcriptional regulator
MPTHLGEFEQLLLFALLRLGEEAHGLNIRRELETRARRPASPGAIYTALSRLEEKGLVSSRTGETAPARGGRRRKYYQLEPEGAAALREAFQGIQRMADGLLPELQSSMGSLPGRKGGA